MDVVCHVITKLELGGAQEVAMRVVSGLDRRRFRPVLVAGPGGLLTDEARALPGVEVQIVPSLIREIHPVQDLKTVWSLVSLFRRLHPKIVHTHSSKAGILGRVAAWLAGVPCILHTVHGYGVTPEQPFWMRRVVIAVERMVGRLTTRWITVSHADRRQGVGWGLFTPSQVSIVRPGINPEPFATKAEAAERQRFRATLGVGPTDLLVGMVACLKPQKAPGDFVHVASIVCRRIPRARFILIGDGILRPEVEALMLEYGVQDRVSLMGWRRDVASLYQAMDVFLLTSRWEGLSCAVLEARASRIPIVATRVGGVEEAIVEPVHGRLCRAGDVQDLAGRVCDILEDEPYRRTLASGNEIFPEEFTINETVKQYQSLYGYLLHVVHSRDHVMRWQTN